MRLPSFQKQSSRVEQITSFPIKIGFPHHSIQVYRNHHVYFFSPLPGTHLRQPVVLHRLTLVNDYNNIFSSFGFVSRPVLVSFLLKSPFPSVYLIVIFSIVRFFLKSILVLKWFPLFPTTPTPLPSSSHTCEVGHVVYVVQMCLFFGSMWNNTLTFYETGGFSFDFAKGHWVRSLGSISDFAISLVPLYTSGDSSLQSLRIGYLLLC